MFIVIRWNFNIRQAWGTFPSEEIASQFSDDKAKELGTPRELFSVQELINVSSVDDGSDVSDSTTRLSDN